MHKQGITAKSSFEYIIFHLYFSETAQTHTGQIVAPKSEIERENLHF